MPDPRLSIVIPTYNRRALLEQLLVSLDALIAIPGELEIIVVDDGSNDGTTEALNIRKGPHPLRVVRHGVSQGPAAARNHGAGEARGEILGFLDSDVIVHSKWWRAAEPHFLDPNIVGVEGATTTPNGSRPPTPFTHLVANTRGGNYITCNIFYRRKIFLRLGGFDQRFRLADREDTDFAFTVIENAGKIIFDPQVRVEHPIFADNYRLHWKKARYGEHEPLLRRKHPKLYRRELKWVDGRAFPVFYWGVYLGLPAAIAGELIGSNLAIISGGVAFFLGWAGSAYALTRKRRTGPGDLLRVLAQTLVLPWLRLYWLARGEWRFRHIRPGSSSAGRHA